jgi:hypothetical protein
VPLGADDEQAAHFSDAFAELNVGAATRHVRRDRDRARLAGALHDLRFLAVILRVQHVVRDLLALQHAAEQLGCFHADRADQHRLVARGNL